jgi:3-hydroxyisobutyrate dehydrogenase
MDKTRTVGFIGLGIMGTAMTLRLIERGWHVAVWNLEPERCAPVVAAGAKACASPSEVAAESDVVMLSVLDANAVEQCVFGPRGVAAVDGRGKILVDHSTCDPQATRDMAQRLEQQTHMRWVDAPVSGGPAAARAGELTVMIGGDAADIAAVTPLLRDLAGNFTHLGPIGAGQTAKLISQAIVGATCVLMAEALALAEASGLDAARLPQSFAGGHADSVLLHKFYPQMQARDFDPPRGYARGLLKDLKAVDAHAQSLGLALPVVEAARARFADYVAQGNAMQDATSIFRMYERK